MSNFKFPDNFLWGAATSSHQVEGGNTNNDWWKWESEGKTQDPSGKACDQYNLFKKDFELAKNLGHNAHRFSLEWSRIEPEEAKFSAEALEHYRQIILALKSLDIEPIVTINHFTLPLWFSEKGGWLSPGSEKVFSIFVEKSVRYLGENLKYWIVLNEPLVYIYNSYINGKWPPGYKYSLPKAVKVFVKLLKAHTLAYTAIHHIYKEKKWGSVKVGIAKNALLFTPCRKKSIFDKLSARLRHYYFNNLFIKSLVSGWCMAPGFGLVRLESKNTLDFIGIDYYTRDFIHFAGLSPMNIFGSVCSLSHHKNAGKRNFLNWEIYPEGVYHMLKHYARYKLPILITENGICTNNDDLRCSFIKEHLRWIARAMGEGIGVIGYLYWALIDNFEWDEGFKPRFGLIEVDYSTQERRIRSSARIYSDIIKTKVLAE